MSKKTIAFLLSLFIVFVLVCMPPKVSFAMDDDERSGLQADTLTINVGYYGGPYYQKKVFTVDELASLGLVSAVYSYIDNMPAVCLDYAKGVPISTIMNAVGIDINSIQRFYFYTNDNKGGYFTDFTKNSLLDTTRYYYPNLVFRYYEPDYDPEEYDEQAAKGAIPVQSMMAISDNWVRHLPGPDDFGEIDYSVQRTFTRFRLMYGQVDTYTRTASKSAKWVHSINIMLGGGPTITTDVSVLEKEVGSKYRVTATVSAADDLIAENIKQALVWSTSDSSVATVDNKGNVTITGEGNVNITVSYQGKVLVSVQVKGIKEDSDKPSDDQSADDDKNIAGPKPPFGGKGTGLPIASLKGNKAGAANKPAKKITPLKSGEKIDLGASANTVFALRLGNANQADGLLSMLKGGEEDSGDQGTVQNWRETEMADSATPLGWIDDDISMRTVLFGALTLLLISIIGRITEFYLQV
jgi:hypothetical protein